MNKEEALNILINEIGDRKPPENAVCVSDLTEEGLSDKQARKKMDYAICHGWTKAWFVVDGTRKRYVLPPE